MRRSPGRPCPPKTGAGHGEVRLEHVLRRVGAAATIIPLKEAAAARAKTAVPSKGYDVYRWSAGGVGLILALVLPLAIGHDEKAVPTVSPRAL